jgi:DNA-binding GntR family transcriptional regulator
LRALTNFYRVLNFQGENRGQTILKDHEAIYERIAAKDEQGASREMAQHMMRDMEHLIMLFKEKEMGEMEDENV